MESIAVIIVAGGSGKRLGGTLPKQFRLLGGVPVLARTINAFAEALPGAQIVVVLAQEQTDFWKNLAARFDVAAHTLAQGGEQRFHSVQNGLKSLKSEPELIAVQDGVRPLGTVEMIRRVCAAAQEHGAAIPVIAPADSLRIVEGESSHPVDRSCLRIVQTPQVFRSEILRGAYQTPWDERFTDDATLVETAGYPVFLAQGEASNLKITTPEDLVVAEALIAAREEAQEDAEHV